MTTNELIDRVAGCFGSIDLKFCSHFQAPPRKDMLGEPAVLRADNWIYFADPVFTDYRRSANLAAFKAVSAALLDLIGPPRTGWGVKSTVRVYPMRKGNDLLLTLLHYLPERKAEGADIVSERLGFAGQTLCLPESVQSVTAEPEGEPLPVEAGTIALPPVEGRLRLRIPDYYS